jgi:hypothetical protein
LEANGWIKHDQEETERSKAQNKKRRDHRRTTASQQAIHKAMQLDAVKTKPTPLADTTRKIQGWFNADLDVVKIGEFFYLVAYYRRV